MNNFDENTMNNIKNMVENGNLSDAISQISPDMISSFSKLLSNNKKNNNSSGNSNSKEFPNLKSKSNNNSNSGFDFGNIDMDTILKIKSIMEKMNDSNNPRANLLSSLKPYLRDEKKGKLDQYANLLKMANVAELLQKDNRSDNDNS